MGIALIVATGAGLAGAGGDPAIASLSRALPSGWRLTVNPDSGGRSLVIWHVAPVRIAGRHTENSPYTGNMPVMARDSSPVVTLALRYRVEPAWNPQQLADARAANAKIYAEIAVLRARYQIDLIATSKGRTLPRSPDEEHRLADYQREEALQIGKLVQLPRCTLGTSSLFDSAETYGQLDLMVDPPGTMREAYAIVELVKRRCP